MASAMSMPFGTFGFLDMLHASYEVEHKDIGQSLFIYVYQHFCYFTDIKPTWTQAE
jgi:hypothetical protein